MLGDSKHPCAIARQYFSGLAAIELRRMAISGLSPPRTLILKPDSYGKVAEPLGYMGNPGSKLPDMIQSDRKRF
jgi:hypothetical protein